MIHAVALAQPTLPGIITSITGIATVVGIIVTVVVGFYQIRRLRDETKHAEAVARRADEESSRKLGIIHELVNSTLTASIESDLEATRQALAMMRDLVSEREASGHDVPVETLAAIRAAEVKIDRLTQQIADRLHSAERVLAFEGNINPRT
jgi:hypothetical protein